MSSSLNQPFSIGIIGGGQLAKMLSIAAYNMGCLTHILTDDPDAPAIPISHKCFLGDLSDPMLIRSFLDSVDIATYETENIPNQLLEVIKRYDKVIPNSNAVYIAKNRLFEKDFINQQDIRTVPYSLLKNHSDLNKIGYPFILKKITGGYDGKLQYRINSNEDLKKIKIHDIVESQQYIIEKYINFSKEVSVILARNKQREVKHFPIAENVHKCGILQSSFVPITIKSIQKTLILDYAYKLAHALDIVGLIAVEFFIDNSGNILVNEIAPRPHNSGHWSIDVCNVSQFEQLVYILMNLPMKDVKLFSACMTKNLLGTEIYSSITKYHNNDSKVYVYGKNKTTSNRKMGHVNILNNSKT
ncbi:MAG: phosphoribosylaminoimidazole carboxylase, ATPase subunit [Candidatus Xenolissoclinum pacificiensis L6]|uniref:N5-carboxyaminoimidazole ribonucleotide synthase n=1 Tax=Candidatus Xenolissoclinum pacificiensis L6 TaxID=1401685 RepID=W2V0X9_9RICK|nr:MAG: phosphoribosylaminoimidazole carboxylase, ATPase subunit [Candidatus Xenolissoclinum pacificiensis L6]